MFIGLPQEGTSDLNSDSTNDCCASESESAITEDTDGPSESEYESETNTSDMTFSLPLQPTALPEEQTDLSRNEERLSDILTKDRLEHKRNLLTTNDGYEDHAPTGSHTPEECEKTVIPVLGAHPPISHEETARSNAWAQ